VEASTVTLVLLVIGVAGFAGTALVGAVLRRGFYATLAAIPLLMAVIAGALMACGGWTAAVVMLLGVWGLVATAAPVGWWAWVPRTFPHDAEAGGGLMVAMIQLSIALGSTVGGLLFDHGGYRSTFAASAGLLLVSAVLVVLASRAEAQTA
jgi:predicted MFS family arabinose efflux permease